MKTKIKSTMLAITLGMCLAACSESEQTDVIEENRYVSFTSEIAPISRATDTHFDANDEIGVFAVESSGNDVRGEIQNSGNYADNVRYAYNGSLFNPVGTGIELPSNGGKLYYCVVYPYTASAANRFTFTVQSDQSGTGYTQSDLLTAETSATDEQIVALKFNHRLSKIIVNAGGSNWPSGNVEIQFTNVATQVSVDLNTSSFTSTGNSNGSVVCTTNGTNSYKAILPPQTIQSGTQFARVTVGGQTYTVTAPTDISVSSGMQSEFTFTMNEEEREIVMFTGDINPWEDEEDTPGGDGDEPSSGDGNSYLVKSIRGINGADEDWNYTFTYNEDGSFNTITGLTGTRTIAQYISDLNIQFNDDGYITQFTGAFGRGERYTFEYENKHVIRAAVESFWGGPYSYENGNIVIGDHGLGEDGDESYTWTNIENKANLDLNFLLIRAYYADSVYPFALMGMLGEKNKNLVDVIQFDRRTIQVSYTFNDNGTVHTIADDSDTYEITYY